MDGIQDGLKAAFKALPEGWEVISVSHAYVEGQQKFFALITAKNDEFIVLPGVSEIEAYE
jgi:hypothetical protein